MQFHALHGQSLGALFNTSLGPFTLSFFLLLLPLSTEFLLVGIRATCFHLIGQRLETKKENFSWTRKAFYCNPLYFAPHHPGLFRQWMLIYSAECSRRWPAIRRCFKKKTLLLPTSHFFFRGPFFFFWNARHYTRSLVRWDEFGQTTPPQKLFFFPCFNIDAKTYAAAIHFRCLSFLSSWASFEIQLLGRKNVIHFAYTQNANSLHLRNGRARVVNNVRRFTWALSADEERISRVTRRELSGSVIF